MEARQALEAQAAAPPALPEPSSAEPSAPPPEDPIVAARRKREYESLLCEQRRVESPA